MSWTAPSGHVYTAGEMVTAAVMNTYISNNLADLSSRLTVATASVLTGETTTSDVYTDLATPGPAVPVTTGTLALVGIHADMSISVAACFSVMGFAVSGATTIAASDDTCLKFMSTAGYFGAFGASFVVNLTAGANTFTAKYHRIFAHTATFYYRHLYVIPLESL